MAPSIARMPRLFRGIIEIIPPALALSAPVQPFLAEPGLVFPQPYILVIAGSRIIAVLTGWCLSRTQPLLSRDARSRQRIRRITIICLSVIAGAHHIVSSPLAISNSLVLPSPVFRLIILPIASDFALSCGLFLLCWLNGDGELPRALFADPGGKKQLFAWIVIIFLTTASLVTVSMSHTSPALHHSYTIDLSALHQSTITSSDLFHLENQPARLDTTAAWGSPPVFILWVMGLTVSSTIISGLRHANHKAEPVQQVPHVPEPFDRLLSDRTALLQSMGLTERESRALAGRSLGCSSSTLANLFRTSASTIRSQQGNGLRKLKVTFEVLCERLAWKNEANDLPARVHETCAFALSNHSIMALLGSLMGPGAFITLILFPTSPHASPIAEMIVPLCATLGLLGITAMRLKPILTHSPYRALPPTVAATTFGISLGMTIAARYLLEVHPSTTMIDIIHAHSQLSELLTSSSFFLGALSLLSAGASVALLTFAKHDADTFHDTVAHQIKKTREASYLDSLCALGMSPLAARIVLLLAQGRPSGAIGKELHVAPGTIKAAMASAYPKLGIHSAADLQSALDRLSAKTQDRQ